MIPTPTTVFEFNEASGNIATSTNGLRTLTGPTGSLNGSGSISRQFVGKIDDTSLGSLSTWSISAPVNIDDVTASETTIIEMQSAIFLNVTIDSKVKLYDTGTLITPAPVYTEDVVHSFIVTSDGTVIKVYVDAVEVLSHTAAIPFNRANSVVLLGGVGGSDMSGTMDSFTYWNVALTAAQVAELVAPPPVSVPVSMALAGAGALAGAAFSRFIAPVDLSGAGAVTVGIMPTMPTVVGLSGSGALAMPLSAKLPLSVDFSGSGRMTAVSPTPPSSPQTGWPYYDYDPGYIEHEYPPKELVEGVDYIYDNVMQADGTTQRMMIRRLRP